MKRAWLDHSYEKIRTGDGSPSLRRATGPAENEPAEAMHHSGGALSESRFIYGRLIEPAFERVSAGPVFLSLGLGLGYNEALIAEQAVLRGQSGWRCVSYESDPVLRECFLGYVRGELAGGEIFETYEMIFAGLREPARVREELRKAFEDGRWILDGPLAMDSIAPFRIQAFLWDAFSQKTSPDLWNEEFLTRFFSEQTASEGWAGLSTYAAIGSLKRALKAAGFLVEIREGFQGKRHSTFASREISPSAPTAAPKTSSRTR